MAPSDAAPQADNVVEVQYDTEEAAQFYKVVMGDGEADIHYGVYDRPDMTCLEASENTVTTLLRLAKSAGVKIDSSTRMLDSGAGNGGSAHKIARETGAHITCLNICAGQNEANLARARKLNIEDQISVMTGSFDKLPDDWSGQFDVIWSQDAYVHSVNKVDLLSEAFRVLKPGGYMVFSDIMASPIASVDDVEWFKKRLHVSDMYTIVKYEEALTEAGFDVLRTRDLTGHLKKNYRSIIERTESQRDRLTKVSDAYIASYTDLLRKNIDVLNDREANAWHAIVCAKPGAS